MINNKRYKELDSKISSKYSDLMKYKDNKVLEVDNFDRPKTDDSCHYNETKTGITM